MWNNFKSGFIKENPVFGLYLGMCSSLAISGTLDNAIGMGACVIAVLMASNIIVSVMRKIIPDEIRIPVYIVIIASLVTVVEMVVQAFMPVLYDSLGVFLGLIVVNCMILGRAEAFASKNDIISSAIDGLGMGLGYTFALLLISVSREFLSTAGLTLSNPFTNTEIFSFTISVLEPYTISLFSASVGAFLTFAIFAAVFTVLRNRTPKKEAK